MKQIKYRVVTLGSSGRRSTGICAMTGLSPPPNLRSNARIMSGAMIESGLTPMRFAQACSCENGNVISLTTSPASSFHCTSGA